MAATGFYYALFKSSSIPLALISLLASPPVWAGSITVSPETFNKSRGLILSLPDKELKIDTPTGTPDPLNSQTNHDTPQLLADTHKKKPLNLDCGMDLYPNTAADLSLTSRLTGTCDVKYHY